MVDQTSVVNLAAIPIGLKRRLDQWKWGETGWLSPANLIVTAAWRKAFHPEQDCCRIWARDSQNKPIPGGYSIRTSDEQVTVPIFSKHDLCTGFCSANSGMQGTRAIEKSRGIGRINRNIVLQQRTVFDTQLFADILNDLNDLSEDASIEALKYLIAIAKRARRDRERADLILQGVPPKINLLGFSSEAKDPEFVKCIAAACLDALYADLGFHLDGVGDFKTASDRRAEKAGDLTLTRRGESVIAVEVKDQSRLLDWQNLNSARETFRRFPNLSAFYFILEARSAAHDPIVVDMARQVSAESGSFFPITFLSLQDLFGLAAPVKGDDYIVKRTAYYVTKAPSIKPSTKQLWVQHSSLD